MAAKTMKKSGYNLPLAAGSITAGGTLGILIITFPQIALWLLEYLYPTP